MSSSEKCTIIPKPHCRSKAQTFFLGAKARYEVYNKLFFLLQQNALFEGDTGLTSGLGTKIPLAMGQLSPCATTAEPTLYSLQATATETHMAQSPCSTRREATAMRSLPSAAREQPPWLLLLDNLCIATKNLCTAMKTQCSQNKTKQSKPTHQPTKKQKNQWNLQ